MFLPVLVDDWERASCGGGEDSSAVCRYSPHVGDEMHLRRAACVGWALLVLYGMRPSDWTGVIVFSFYGSIVGAVALSLVGAVAAARDPDLPGWIRWLAVAAGITIPLSVILFAAVLIHALSGSDG